MCRMSLRPFKLRFSSTAMGIPRPSPAVSPHAGAVRPERADMNNTQIDTQYSTGVSRRSIEQALIAAGLDLNHVQPAELWQLEDFHTMGRIATSQLVDLAGITPEDKVLDAG